MEENELLAFRRQKLQQLLERKVNPFGGRFDVSGTIGEVRQDFLEGRPVRAAGRITALRDMGKSQFMDVSDLSGRNVLDNIWNLSTRIVGSPVLVIKLSPSTPIKSPISRS